MYIEDIYRLLSTSTNLVRLDISNNHFGIPIGKVLGDPNLIRVPKMEVMISDIDHWSTASVMSWELPGNLVKSLGLFVICKRSNWFYVGSNGERSHVKIGM